MIAAILRKPFRIYDDCRLKLHYVDYFRQKQPRCFVYLTALNAYFIYEQ